PGWPPGSASSTRAGCCRNSTPPTWPAGPGPGWSSPPATRPPPQPRWQRAATSRTRNPTVVWPCPTPAPWTRPRRSRRCWSPPVARPPAWRWSGKTWRPTSCGSLAPHPTPPCGRAGMCEAVWAELLKARRSRLPWITIAAFVVAPAVGGLFMFILADPARARSLGLLGTKAQLAGGTADWPSYLGLLAQTVAVGGTIIFGLIVIWTFGREFSDHTVKDLLALPTPRTTIVAAKFVVTGAWCLLLALQTYLLGLAI